MVVHLEMLQPRQNRGIVPYRVNFTRRQAFGAGAAGVGAYLGRGWGWRAVRSIGRYLGSLKRNNPQAYGAQMNRMAAARQLTKKRKYSNDKNVGKAKKPKSLRKRIAILEKKTASVLSTLTYRLSATQSVLTTANTATYGSFAMNQASNFEAALAQLKYYDPAVPGTLVTADGASGSYERHFRMKGYMSLEMKNNYQIPVLVKVYTYQCAADTSYSPTGWLDNILPDSSNSTKASPLIYPTDGKDMGDLYKLLGCKTFSMQPGDKRFVSTSQGEISYDPSEYDNHPFENQADFKTTYFIVRVTGAIAHDKTTTTNVGLAAGGIDIIQKTVYRIKYNAGGPALNYTYISSGYDTMAAGPLVSQVVVDNQEYSAV